MLNRYRLLLPFAAILLFLAGFAAGQWLNLRDLASQAPEPPATPRATFALPAFDVPGSDIEGLPRYPGAVRVEYRQGLTGDLIETEVEYVISTDFEAVHDYYRQVFDEEGWTVADLGIYQGEWTFFVVSGEREALVELEARESLVEIEIEITEPSPDTP